MKHLANGITLIRILTSILILFTVPLSIYFLVLYSIGGTTDVMDGIIARKTHTESKSGAILDSVADLVFLMAVFINLSPILMKLLPHWVIWAILVIVILRALAYFIGILKLHQFIALHTILNKITGAVLFLVPYIIIELDVEILCYVLCILAISSAFEELCINLTSKHYNPDVRSILCILNLKH